MKTKSIAIVTRTFNRPNFFERCRKSVESQKLGGNHYVLYQDKNDESYIKKYDVVSKYVDVKSLNFDLTELPPKSAQPPVHAMHNLFFNEIYEDIEEEWVYHLDDDNILLKNAFNKLRSYMTDEVELIVFRYRFEKLNRTIPNSSQIRNRTIRVGHIDTCCFLIRTEFARKLKWDGWKSGDYRFIKAAADSTEKVRWVNCVIAVRDYSTDTGAYVDLESGDYHTPPPPPEFPKIKSIEKISSGGEHDQIDSDVIVKESPIKKVKLRNIPRSSAVDVDTLVCLNSCEQDATHLQAFKKSYLYKRLISSDDIGIIEFSRGNEIKVFAAGNRLLLAGDERYDKLHIKTYDMIQWCVSKLKFNQLVKLDANLLTYTSVGERTRGRICGADRVLQLIFKHKRKSYDGTSGRYFYVRDFKNWCHQKKLKIDTEIPEWAHGEPWYYCGKAYKISYDFAKFIATSDVCSDIVKQHDVKGNEGFHPLGVEDVMVGRMHEKYKEGA